MVNKVFLLGRLGKDVETSEVGGQTVAKLTVATTENYTKDGERKEHTEWHTVKVWGSQAGNCAKYLVKGQQVYVEGKLRTRSWDKQDGSKAYATEILATNVQFLEKPKGEGQKTVKADTFDEIPF